MGTQNIIDNALEVGLMETAAIFNETTRQNLERCITCYGVELFSSRRFLLYLLKLYDSTSDECASAFLFSYTERFNKK